jgi:cysteinyl-tRNA synthetase
MAEAAFGPEFEIHGGGLDLVFPHHENELAQSRALGHEFAHVWMHNGMLEFTGEKMAKSVGNIVTLREALDTWGRETILLLFMGAHWRKPMELSQDTIAQAKAQSDAFRDFLVSRDLDAPATEQESLAAALDDDFNTPAALALFHDWRRRGLGTDLAAGLEVFGLGALAERSAAPSELVELARRREQARSEREFAEADRLRAEIEAAGWEVRDVPDGFQLVPK